MYIGWYHLLFHEYMYLPLPIHVCISIYYLKQKDNMHGCCVNVKFFLKLSPPTCQFSKQKKLTSYFTIFIYVRLYNKCNRSLYFIFMKNQGKPISTYTMCRYFCCFYTRLYYAHK